MIYFGIIRIMRKKDFTKKNPGVRFITHSQPTKKGAEEEMKAMLNNLREKGEIPHNSDVKYGVYSGDKDAYLLQAEICLQQ